MLLTWYMFTFLKLQLCVFSSYLVTFLMMVVLGVSLCTLTILPSTCYLQPTLLPSNSVHQSLCWWYLTSNFIYSRGIIHSVIFGNRQHTHVLSILEIDGSCNRRQTNKRAFVLISATTTAPTSTTTSTISISSMLPLQFTSSVTMLMKAVVAATGADALK